MTKKIKFLVDSEIKKDKNYRIIEAELPQDADLTVQDFLRLLSKTDAPELVYYDHSCCGRGICGRCALILNGKKCLACITPLPNESEITIEPVGNPPWKNGPSLPY